MLAKCPSLETLEESAYKHISCTNKETLLWMTRKELAELETVAKRFHRFISSHQLPQRHIIPNLSFAYNSLRCWGYYPDGLLNVLELSDINIESVNAYVRFKHVNLDNAVGRELEMSWLRKLRHAFKGCWVDIFLHSDVTIDDNHWQQMTDKFDLLSEAHQIHIAASREPSKQKDHHLMVPIIMRWLHAGRAASQVKGFKLLNWPDHVNQQFYTQLRKEATTSFIADRDEHPYRISFNSHGPYHLEDETYADSLENEFTGERLSFAIRPNPIVGQGHLWIRCKKDIKLSSTCSQHVTNNYVDSEGIMWRYYKELE